MKAHTRAIPTRCVSVRSSRISIRWKPPLRVSRLASEAATASFTSRIIRCWSTMRRSSRTAPDHYNKVVPPDSPFMSQPFELRKIAEADFPSRYGHFRIYGFQSGVDRDAEEAVVLRMGDLEATRPPLVRIHSECLTGDVFHSLRCDCRAQLELALGSIAREGSGLLIYEHQEGRGIGLLNKLRAYELQDRGADTVEANEQLGFEVDLRSYQLPGAILRYFGLTKVRLLSNNPEKVEAVERASVEVVERIPCLVDPVDSSEAYLRTKRDKMGHWIDGL